MVIKVPNVILRKTVPRILHPLSQFGNHCDRLWRKRNFPLHDVPYVLNWRYLDILLARVVMYTMKSTRVAAAHVDLRCPVEKHITFVPKKRQMYGVNLCNVAGTVYFTLQKHQI